MRGWKGSAASSTDPALCRAGVVSTLETLLAHTLHNAQRGTPAGFRQLSGLASLLGVERLAAAQLATVFEAQGPLPIPLAARQLGCHQRTLELRLREEGLTAEAVRQTVRLLAAAQALRGPRSLTEIAHHCGFADLSHMSRAFGVACGMDSSQSCPAPAHWRRSVGPVFLEFLHESSYHPRRQHGHRDLDPDRAGQPDPRTGRAHGAPRH